MRLVLATSSAKALSRKTTVSRRRAQLLMPGDDAESQGSTSSRVILGARQTKQRPSSDAVDRLAGDRLRFDRDHEVEAELEEQLEEDVLFACDRS